MTKRWLPMLALAAACWVSPASAQTAMPYAVAVESSRPLSDDDQAREIMNRYGYCIVTKHLGGVRRALAMPDEAQQTEALRKLATEDCLFNGRLKMSPTLFRGAVYRAMYIRDFGMMSDQTRAIVTPVAGQASVEVDAAPSITFGGCVAKLAPDATRELVISNVATPLEKKAIAALRPVLGDCVPPKQQVRVTVRGLQATLAESLYKRTLALTGRARVAGKN